MPIPTASTAAKTATDYFGPDSFQYRAYDGAAYSAVVAAAINVMQPTIDVDTDSNNNGLIEAIDDPIEMGDPGNIVQYNWNDDNGNGFADRSDPAPFVNGAGQPVSDDLDRATLSTMLAPNGFTVELIKHGTQIKLWKTMDKQALPLTYTIGADTLPTQFYIEGYDYGQATVEAVLKNPAGTVVHRDEIKVTVASVDLVGYRPQTEGPGYGNPFPKTAVPWQKESDPGIGIRKNGDDDDDDGVADLTSTDVDIAGENDLIEIGMRMEAGGATGLQKVLRRGNAAINVFEGRDKFWPLLDSVDPTILVTPQLTVIKAWVEWVGAVPGSTELRLELQDARNGNTALVDSVVFHPFTSVVIAFGGNNNSPLDPTDGAFNIAEYLYEDGYDVHAYHEGIVDAIARVPYHEVKDAIERRGVTGVAIFGYSYGGGATYLLAQQLKDNPPAGNWGLLFTAYIDAVVHDSFPPLSETGLPIDTLYHVNYYQSLDPLNGSPVAGAAANVHVTLTPWGAGLDHGTIDGHANVQERIENGFDGPVDPQHDGLTDRVPR